VPNVTLGEVIATIRVAAELQGTHGRAALANYVISGFEGVEDLKTLLALFAWAADARIPASETAGALAGAPEVNLVPLMESSATLAKAGVILDELMSDAALRAQVASRGDQIEVMLGYSDTNKESGYLASSWSLHRAEDELVSRAAAHKIRITLFHGRGGAIGRGGGPTRRAIMGQHPGGLAAGFKVTEQGEVIASRYADPTIAYREADQTLAALFTALQPAAATRLQAVEGEFGGLLAQLTQESGEKYSALLRGEEGFERSSCCARGG
jgi:phosphoenolpyruvate carboxylase